MSGFIRADFTSRNAWPEHVAFLEQPPDLQPPRGETIRLPGGRN